VPNDEVNCPDVLDNFLPSSYQKAKRPPRKTVSNAPKKPEHGNMAKS